MISRHLSNLFWRLSKFRRRAPDEVQQLIREAQRARAKHRRSKHIREQIRAVRHALLRNERTRA